MLTINIQNCTPNYTSTEKCRRPAREIISDLCLPAWNQKRRAFVTI